MNCLPLISRELRAGSRRWTTYWLRLLAASSVMGGVLFWFATDSPSTRAGGEMFALMHQVVLAAIWVLVPLMTCDCLSQEKREGTLGLLFLTNLRAGEIVLAKAIAHGLRALTLWLAAIPVIGIPLLMGGLSWKEVLFSCGLAFISLCLALAVGLLASALGKRINEAVAWTLLLAPLACGFFTIGTLYFLAVIAYALKIIPPRELSEVFSSVGLVISVPLVWNEEGLWSELFGRSNGKNAPAILLGTALLTLLAAVGAILFSTWIVAPIIRRTWQDKPKTKRQEEVDNIFFKPVFWLGFFKRWMRRSLERNPIGWLEKRSWQGRTTAWVWLAVMISLSTGLAYGTTGYGQEDLEIFNALMWMLLGTIAFVAAGSFRRERETGALELILVTPMSERQIIFGRLRGLWSQFLPSVAVWSAVVIYLSSAAREWHVRDFVFWTVSYLVVPVVGLYFSLRSRFVLLSWLATLAACFGLPYFVWLVSYWVVFKLWGTGDIYDSSLRFITKSSVIVLPVQFGLGALLTWRLYKNLRRRSFSFR